MNDKTVKILIIVIFVLAVFFRFWQLSSWDMISDDALYSVRALSWTDYLGEGQTTPIQWLGEIPWWGSLSFHDAPPLVFLIQNLCFKIFGPTGFGAKIPFALSGLAVVGLVGWIIFLISRDKRLALLAAFMAAISSYLVWSSRVGYLEGVMIVFVLLAILFFVRFIQKNNYNDLLICALSVGLAVISKYTAGFLVLAIFIFLLLFRRSVFKNKKFWWSVLLFFVVLLPVIIYNFKVFQARGHFDAVISSVLGMQTEDFSALAGRTVDLNPVVGFVNVIKSLTQTSSAVFIVLFIISILYFIFKIVKKRAKHSEVFVFLSLTMGLIMFSFIGHEFRFLLVLIPFFIMLAVLMIYDLFVFLNQKDFKIANILVIVLLVLVLAGEAFYSINTNLSVKPVGASPLVYSDSRFYSHGFNGLDNYLLDAFSPLPQPQPVRKMSDFSVDVAGLKDKQIVFFDETLNWFALSWYVNKYYFNYRLPIISLHNYFQSAPKEVEPFTDMKYFGVKGFYYVFGADDSVLDPVKKENVAMRSNMKMLADQLEQSGNLVKEIYDYLGQKTIKIYYLELN